MPEAALLPEDHRRSLTVTAKIVEATLGQIEEIVRAKGVSTPTVDVAVSYTEDERARLLAFVAEMRRRNHAMIVDLGLPKEHLDEAQRVHAKLTHLWSVLVDSTANGLRGFGPLTAVQAQTVDRYVGPLLALLEEVL